MSFVDGSRWQIANDLCSGKVSPGEFCLAVGTTVADAPQFALALLRKAVAEKKGDLVEFGLFVGFRFGFPNEALHELNELATADWHTRHEDVVTVLGKMRSEDSVEALFAAAKSQHDYLAYDDAFALGVKAIWSLSRIEASATIVRLNELRRSGNPVLEKTASERLAVLAKDALSLPIREQAAKALET